MASSRLEKIGTIFTRVTGLIRSGAMKMEERPIWYDLYKIFPPAEEPKYDRRATNVPIKNIFYEEDTIRSQFHKRMAKTLPSINLQDRKQPTTTQRLIHVCKKLESEKHLSKEQAFEQALDIIKTEGFLSKQSPRGEKSTSKLPGESVVKDGGSQQSTVNISDIFKS